MIARCQPHGKIGMSGVKVRALFYDERKVKNNLYGHEILRLNFAHNNFWIQ